MLIIIPDPNPGRCLNIRHGDRCLHYDEHDSRCQFPQNDPEHDLYWQVQSRGWMLDRKTPEPWVSPLDALTEEDKCSCAKCDLNQNRMIVCSECGNKRCPKATNHDLDCTRSNAPGQKGSSWENYLLDALTEEKK